MSEEALTAGRLAQHIAGGAVSARQATDACLARIADRDEVVRAFVHLSPEHARAQADALDAHRKAGRPLGPLHGVPVALKDIIDTADYPTENGTPLDAGRRPSEDATLARRLRAAGAVILGKTVTTEFAFFEPGPTTNPHNERHTPGGSSSGSAAAVGDGMVPLALGSQTAGSTIRPAAYCGIVGYKPTHGAVPLTGVLTTAPSLDTIGIFAPSLGDAALLGQTIMGADGRDSRTPVMPVPNLTAAAAADPPVRPTLAIVRGPTFAEASADTVGLFDEIETTLGERADPVDLPPVFDNALPAQRRVMTVGFARHLRAYRERGGDAVSAVMREAMDEGAATSAVDFLAATDWQAVLRAGLDEIFKRYDAILTPSAPGEAPEGLGATGRPVFNALWTFVGAPCITLPVGRGANGLPLGVQLVGRPGEDARLFRTARWLSAALSP